MKLCSICKKAKELKEFHKRKASKDGLQNTCKECVRIRDKQKVGSEKEKERSKKKYYKLMQNKYYKEKEIKRKYAYKINNPLKTKVSNHEHYIKHKFQYNQRTHKRNSITKNLLNTLTINEWNECLKYFDYKDAYTGLPMMSISQDHIIPVSKGGGYIKQNIIPCERKINASKHNKDMQTWYIKQTFFSYERLNKILNYINCNDNIQQSNISI